MKEKFELKEFDIRWTTLFDLERRKLEIVFGNNKLSIHHIGSTAIPFTLAKPEIDILVVVRDILELPKSDIGMVKLGYTVRGQCLENGGVLGRYYYSKDIDNVRTHKVHVCEIGHPEIMDKLLFVKYLNDHKVAAEEYSNLKKRLSRKYNYGKEFTNYLNGKSDFINRVLFKSRKENIGLGYHFFLKRNNEIMKYGKYEYERLFLMNDDCLDRYKIERSKKISDKYILGTNIRLREVNEEGVKKFKLTKKEKLDSKKNGVLKINTIYLHEDEFKVFYSLKGIRIDKVRSIIKVNDYNIGIDIVYKGNRKIYLAEVEFESEEEMKKYVFPLDYIAEVTGIIEYSGYELARNLDGKDSY